MPPYTERAYLAMRELRPAVASSEQFTMRVDEVQRPEGYRLVAAFESPDAADAVAVAGFRVLHNLASGHHVYVDDLSTLAEARGRGHAGALLGWLLDEAARLRCEQLHLDSGVGPDRVNAHRLYFNHGLSIVSHHFARTVMSR